VRDSEKGLGFLLGHEEPETKAQRIKEVGDSIKRMTRHTYKDTPVAFDPINLDTPLFTPTPTVASKETPKTKPTPIKKYRGATEQLTRPTNQRTIEQLIALRKWAQPEADSINSIKKMAWEESPIKSPPPKKVTAQDVINVYKPKERNQRKKNESTPTIKQEGKRG